VKHFQNLNLRFPPPSGLQRLMEDNGVPATLSPMPHYITLYQDVGAQLILIALEDITGRS